ncbi:diguanylate cyclase [Candidatus Frankia alpina]|uniref:Diguanylate cyclase n=1 Tax=Candidatus Frankia alpina TaxID=2699483 RepID=A0A4S5EE03_9ACTN|nr:diguanylate cyclase [Candidatus Frankia alpina]
MIVTRGESSDLFEVLDIAVVETVVRDHRIRCANGAACAILGRSEAEVVGLTWEDVTVPEDRERWAAQARIRFTTGQPRGRMAVRLWRPDGTVVHAMCTTVLLADSDGEQYFLSCLQDMSEEIAAPNWLRLVVENTPVSMFLVDRNGRVLMSEGTVNPESAVRLSEARETSIFQSFADHPRGISILKRALKGERVYEIFEMFGRYLDMHFVPISGADGKVSFIAAVATDITERQQAMAELQLRSAEQALVADLGQRALEAQDPNVLWEWTATALTSHLGADLVQVYELDESGDCVGLLAREDRRAPSAATRVGPVEDTGGAGVTVGTGRLVIHVGQPDKPLALIEIRRPVGTKPFTEQDVQLTDSVAAVLGPAAIRFRMENEIRYQALHDGLTGLPNRTALLDHLERALRRAYHDDRRVGMLFIDLDGFKAVNDTFGHQAGDELLQTIAPRLKHAVRPGDLVGRLSGDEFAVLCEDVGSIVDLEAIADRVLTALKSPSRLREHSIALTGSVGLALSGLDLHKSEDLLNAADIAMYVAKQTGPGRRMSYNKTMHSRLAKQVIYADDVHRGGLSGDDQPGPDPASPRGL